MHALQPAIFARLAIALRERVHSTPCLCHRASHGPSSSSPAGRIIARSMSFADGDSLDGWHLPAATNLPGAALLGDPFGGLEEGLALAAGSAPDTDISAGIHSFFDGSPWFEGGAHGGGAPPDLQRAPGQQPAGFLGSEEFPLRAASDATQVVWRCLGGCAQPCSRCESGAEQEWCKYNHSDSRTLPLHLRPGACLLRRRRRWATTSWWASEELRTERCV